MQGDYNVVNLKEYLSGTRGDIVTGTTKAVRLVDLFTKERLTQYEESRKQFDKMNATFAMHPDRVLIPYYYIQDYVDRDFFEELAVQISEPMAKEIADKIDYYNLPKTKLMTFLCFASTVIDAVERAVLKPKGMDPVPTHEGFFYMGPFPDARSRYSGGSWMMGLVDDAEDRISKVVTAYSWVMLNTGEPPKLHFARILQAV